MQNKLQLQFNPNPDKNMNKKFLALASVVALVMSGCGYKLGGLKPGYMKDMNTFCVEMFENNSIYPNAGMLMTTALGNALQSDGAYRIAPRNEADFIVKGVVTRVHKTSLLTDTEDTYISRSIGLEVSVDYQIVDRKTGKIIRASEATGSGSYYNQIGNTMSAQDTALSYATRRAADSVALNLTSQ